MKSKEKLPIEPDEDAQEWDPRTGMGILPEGIALTQNIGCVGKPKIKKTSTPKNVNDNK